MLQEGDVLSLADGREVPVQSIETITYNHYVNVYNFEVEDFHTYYVSNVSVLVHNKTPCQQLKSINTQKPLQIHHFASNKNKKYTPEFEKITKKYNLNLNDSWNKKALPHQGRYPNAYHDYVLKNMRTFDKIAKGNQKKFLHLYEKLKKEISDNPAMLYKAYWKNK